MFSLVRLFVLILLLILAKASLAQESYPVEVDENIYSYGDPAGYFSMFVVTNARVIAIEPVNTVHSEGLVAAIKSVTDQPMMSGSP
jgi:hypothetical protein